jgi:hypothetical protein
MKFIKKRCITQKLVHVINVCLTKGIICIRKFVAMVNI